MSDAKKRVLGKPKAKKRYGIVSVSSADIAASRAEEVNQGRGGGTTAVQVPLTKIDGINAEFLLPQFELPSVNDCEDSSIEVAYRILGFPITEKLLNHLPDAVTTDLIGQLLEYFPLAFHRRFGATYSDRICSVSTRTGKCPICDGRKHLFGSDEYSSGVLTKYDIMRANFGTRNIALFFAMVYYNGELTGPHPVVTNLTNPFAKIKRHDNFFDLVGDLTKVKSTTSIRRSEALPEDYYSNGEGSRWLIAEYKRAVYEASDSQGSQGLPSGTAPRRSGGAFWKLNTITPMKTIEGVGDAADIWWPELEVGGNIDDALEFIDVIGVVNHTDPEELGAITKDAVDYVMGRASRANAQAQPDAGGLADDTAIETEVTSDSDYCWQDIVSATPNDLVDLVEEHGGDVGSAEDLADAGDTAGLRRFTARLLGIRPERVTRGARQDDDLLPF